jgi:hypothetical protein
MILREIPPESLSPSWTVLIPGELLKYRGSAILFEAMRFRPCIHQARFDNSGFDHLAGTLVVVAFFPAESFCLINNGPESRFQGEYAHRSPLPYWIRVYFLESKGDKGNQIME